MRILVVEDDPALLQQLGDQLRERGYSVDQAADGAEGLFLATDFPLDLAIIDIGLPKLSGIELIRRLRAADRHYPVLVLTARDGWQDKVEGLDAGADDYLAKPFHFPELFARINALLRRAAGYGSSLVRHGPFELDTATQSLKADGAEVDLTAYEYKVIEYLMLHPGQVVSKTELTEHIYEQDFDRDSNVLEVFVGRLRRKLDPQRKLQPIRTLRGRGYRFDPPGEA